MLEVRRIRVSDAELQGLIGRLISTGYSEPGDRNHDFTVFDMSYACESPVKLKVTGQFAHGRQFSNYIASDEIVAAFVLFCEEGLIPICRESEKSVTRINSGVAFDMVIQNLVSKQPGYLAAQ